MDLLVDLFWMAMHSTRSELAFPATVRKQQCLFGLSWCLLLMLLTLLLLLLMLLLSLFCCR